jgi:hypothetical protein
LVVWTHTDTAALFVRLNRDLAFGRTTFSLNGRGLSLGDDAGFDESRRGHCYEAFTDVYAWPTRYRRVGEVVTVELLIRRTRVHPAAHPPGQLRIKVRLRPALAPPPDAPLHVAEAPIQQYFGLLGCGPDAVTNRPLQH